MKRTLLALALAAAAALAPRPASGAISTKMAFTARLADTGTAVTGTHTFVFRLFDSASGGTKLWEETQTGVAVNAGVANATLGSVATIPAGLFNGAPLYLEVVYDSTVLSPRLEMLTVGYALRADTADNALQAVNATSATNAANAVNATTAATALAVPWSGVTAVPFTSSGGDAGTAATISRGDHRHDAHYYTQGQLATAGGGGQVAWGNVTSPAFTPAGGDAGTAPTIARGDHLHDAHYYTQAQLGSAGTFNASTNPVHWTKLKGAPGSAVVVSQANGATTAMAPAFACTNHEGSSVSITTPGPGTIVVSGQVALRASHTNGVEDYAWVYVGTTPTNCAPDAPASGLSGTITLPASLPTMTPLVWTVPVHRVVPAPVAGTYTFYVNGHGTTTVQFWYSSLVPVFLPTW